MQFSSRFVERAGPDAIGAVGPHACPECQTGLGIDRPAQNALACSAAYVTPVSSPVNMMVLEPGGYTFMDFFKVGIPLLFLSMIVTVVLVGAIYMN